MSCLLSTVYSIDGQCNGVGGAKAIYIANYDSLQTYTKDVDNSITALGITSPPQDYFTFEADRAQIEVTENNAVNRDARTTVYTQTVSIPLSTHSVETRNHLLLLAKGILSIIIQDNSGLYWLLGEDSGAMLTTAAKSTKTLDSMSGYILTFEALSKIPMSHIDDIAIFSIT